MSKLIKVKDIDNYNKEDFTIDNEDKCEWIVHKSDGRKRRLRKRHCIECGKIIISERPRCCACYRYHNKHPERKIQRAHYGELTITENNAIICHICGKEYTYLTYHLITNHNITKVEYCRKFGLDTHSVLDLRDKSRFDKKNKNL